MEKKERRASSILAGGIEQNPPTSKTQTSLLAGGKYSPHPWAKMAKAGKKVTQFVKGRKCVAVVVDEKRYMLTFPATKLLLFDLAKIWERELPAAGSR